VGRGRIVVGRVDEYHLVRNTNTRCDVLGWNALLSVTGSSEVSCCSLSRSGMKLAAVVVL
jgi:hypothetical protein